MKKTFISFALFIVFCNVYSQSNITNRGAVALKNDTFVNYQVKDFIKEAERNGANTQQYLDSYFLFDNWKNNCQIQVSGKKVLLNNINLNLETNQFMYKTHKDSVFTIPSSYIDFVVINFSKYDFKRFNSQNKFVEVLLDDSQKISLYKGYNIKVLPKSDISVMTDKPYDRTRKETKYYYTLNESELINFKMKKKETLRLFNKDEHSKVTKFAKDRKLSFKREKDVVEIIDYYNSL